MKTACTVPGGLCVVCAPPLTIDKQPDPFPLNLAWDNPRSGNAQLSTSSFTNGRLPLSPTANNPNGHFAGQEQSRLRGQYPHLSMILDFGLIVVCW